MIPLHILKSSLYELVLIHIAELYPSALAFHAPKDPILVIPVRPVECAVFGCARDSASGDLLDVDVGGIGLDVFGYGEGDGGHGDCFAEEPADALLREYQDWSLLDVVKVGTHHLKNVVGIIRKGFVQQRMSAEAWGSGAFGTVP